MKSIDTIKRMLFKIYRFNLEPKTIYIGHENYREIMAMGMEHWSLDRIEETILGVPYARVEVENHIDISVEIK